MAHTVILWQLHTLTRPAEAVKPTWAEMDFDQHIWNIPADRMESGRPHSIPLTDATISLLKDIYPHSGNGALLFPSSENANNPIDIQAVNAQLADIDFSDSVVCDDLREIASATLKMVGWDSELINVALDKIDDIDVRHRYSRVEYIERRRTMMQGWSEHIINATLLGLMDAISQQADKR